jgi:hypothetical protein
MATDATLFADHEREFLELTKSLQERVAAAGHGEIAGEGLRRMPWTAIRRVSGALHDGVCPLAQMILCSILQLDGALCAGDPKATLRALEASHVDATAKVRRFAGATVIYTAP